MEKDGKASKERIGTAAPGFDGGYRRHPVFRRPCPRCSYRQPIGASGCGVVGQHLDQTSEGAAGLVDSSNPEEGGAQSVGHNRYEMVASLKVRPFAGQHCDDLFVVKSSHRRNGENHLPGPTRQAGR